MNYITKYLTKSAIALGLISSMSIAHAEFAGNIAVSNNYLWRGLTQSIDETAISGGLDYAHESGFYVGTWASNVSYAADDSFSYEHDLYVGYSGVAGEITYDIGYLYYNYNSEANFDFGEIYGSLGYNGFTLTAYLFAHTEAEETDGIANAGRVYDYDFGSTYYISLDYSFEIPDLEGWEFGIHGGYHDGDFVDGFNFADGTFDYFDWNISVGKGGFSFMVSGTDLDESPTSLNNDDLKFVVGYGIDF